MSIKVGLIVGHSSSSQGASNPGNGLTEFQVNDYIAQQVAAKLDAIGDIVPVVIYRNRYATLPDDVNRTDVDFALSLHCNAFNTTASGTEMLYYHRSRRGKAFAEILQRRVVGALGLPDRGIKGKGSEDRGGYLLKETNMACVIAEPFFIDNNSDFESVEGHAEIFLQSYVDSITEFADRYS